MHLLNFRNEGINLLVYGAPRHEWFYGHWDLEYYHEFCDVDTTMDEEVIIKERDLALLNPLIIE